MIPILCSVLGLMSIYRRLMHFILQNLTFSLLLKTFYDSYVKRKFIFKFYIYIYIYIY
jgi:hypothetical protein